MRANALVSSFSFAFLRLSHVFNSLSKPKNNRTEKKVCLHALYMEYSFLWRFIMKVRQLGFFLLSSMTYCIHYTSLYLFLKYLFSCLWRRMINKVSRFLFLSIGIIVGNSFFCCCFYLSLIPVFDPLAFA